MMIDGVDDENEQSDETKNKDQPWNTVNVDALDGLNSGDLAPVIELLRSSTPLHSEIRLLLAEMLDPDAEGKRRLTWGYRQSNRPTSDSNIMRDIILGKEASDLYAEIGKGGYESAIKVTAEKNDVSEPTVKNAYRIWKRFKEGLEEDPSDLV